MLGTFSKGKSQIILSCAIATCIGLVFILKNIDFNSPSSVADIDSKKAYELAEYYFNQDADPAGPYDLIKARDYYYLALKDNPQDYPIGWYQYGRIDFLEGKFDAALQKFKTQVRFFEDRAPNVYYMMGLTYGYRARNKGEIEDWKRAEESFLKFITYKEDSWAARVDLSWVYFAQGKYEEMVPLLEEVLEVAEGNPWLHNMYGLALLNTERREEAKVHFLIAQDAVIGLTPEDWGKAYPGNNPDNWGQGLSEFRDAIQKNLALTASE